MIHQPASSFYQAQAIECLLEAEELLKLRESITKVYVEKTGKPVWVVSEDLERDVFMSATEAQAHGLVDFVAFPETRAEISRKQKKLELYRGLL
jgi:ATP-dependent Clp protease protease subunit